MSASCATPFFMLELPLYLTRNRQTRSGVGDMLKRLLLTLPFFLAGDVAAADELADLRARISEQGHRFTVTENRVTRLDPADRLRLGGAIPPTDPPAAPTWDPRGRDSTRSALDWRDHNYQNYVSGVRDQGNCSSCWAFAAVALLESMKMISYGLAGQDPDYSEQSLLSCSEAGDCEIGQHGEALAYIQAVGVPPEYCFPYEADDTVPCASACPESAELANHVSGFDWVTLDNVDIAAIKSALEFGPVITWFKVYESFYAYDAGVYSAYGSTYTGSNHSVLIVGYDDADNCWIAKNSWGPDWGEDGFFRIDYDSGCDFGFWTMNAQYQAPHQGPNWYVATQGDDVYNSGSQALPFETARRAGYVSSASDSIRIAAGQYQTSSLPQSGYCIGEGDPGQVVFESQSSGGVQAPVVGELTIENAVFVGQPASSGATVLLLPGSLMHLRRCAIQWVQGDGVFFRCLWSSGLSFSGCSILSCDADGSLIHLTDDASVQFDSCLFADNGWGPIVLNEGAGGLAMSCSNMFGNSGGDYSGPFAGFHGVSGNISADPQFCDVDSGDYTLFIGSPCLPDHNECGSLIGAYGLGCSGKTVHVSTAGSDISGTGSEGNPYQTIGYAVIQSEDYDTIAVRPGTYTGGLNRNINFLGKTLSVIGVDGPETTIIDCQSQGRAFDISGFDWISNDALIDGFTIRNGLAAAPGGAAYVYGAPRIARCRFIDNASTQGGAVYLSPGLQEARIDDCLFEGNHASMVGGALYAAWPWDLKIGGSVFDGNSAGERGGAFAFNGVTDEGQVQVDSCTFVANVGPIGSQLYIIDSGFQDPPGLALTASILSHASGGEPLELSGLAELTLSCNNIFGNEGGDWVGPLSGFEGTMGNFSEDPLFCDFSAGDHSLNDISPCLPANNSCGVLIGAVGEGCGYPVQASESPAASGLAVHCTPNPFNPSTKIVFTLASGQEVSLRLYDLGGRLLRSLVEGEALEPGVHTVDWDGKAGDGRPLPSGVYLYRLSSGDQVVSGKATLLK